MKEVENIIKELLSLGVSKKIVSVATKWSIKEINEIYSGQRPPSITSHTKKMKNFRAKSLA